MKKIVLCIFLLSRLLNANALQKAAQDSNYRPNHLSLGFHLNNFQNDFGMGLNITSPYFANGSVALKATFNLAYRDGTLKTDTMSNWYPYSSIQFGCVGVGGMVGKHIRTYGAGGIMVMFPNSEFSSTKTEIGGWGVWGFEFILNPMISYYIELGGVGIGARADKMNGQPIYSNGFSTTVGLHVYL